MGIIIGVPLGVLLHGFVMSQINIDMVAFKVVILPKSYVIGIFTVLVFLVVVDLVMRRKIEKIDMAESLKSVE
jgi:putative ABC transport system permease protein